MAHFKLYLLTPINDSDLSKFIKTPISVFDSQIVNNKRPLDVFGLPKQNYCYTYNEKVSFHQNGQKELSFSMDRKLLIDDNWTLNPFVNEIKDNSIILLEDKYDKQYVFIINKITFAFKETNITYQYSCQDAFSYQNTRQNSGYTIVNDPSRDDFIGPKTIDWWVIRKIVPECFIQYKYIPINNGLCKITNNNSTIYTYFTTEERNNWDDTVQRVIIKEPFLDEAYNTTIPFSCSGSNANAALIALGEELQLMLHTCEIEVENGQFAYYFWYEPKQNQDITGLSYSPKSQVTNFGLTLNSNSLTTVLNVNAKEGSDDELITLLPSTPYFFTSYFMNTEEWENTIYSDGFFTNLIYGKKLFYTSYEGVDEQNTIYVYSVSNEAKTYEDNNWLELKVTNTDSTAIVLPFLYDRFTANWEDNYFTSMAYSLGGNNYTFDSKNEVLYLRIGYEGKYYLIKEDEEIPFELRGKQVELSLLVKLPNNITDNTISEVNLYYIYLTFYRVFSEEEKQFAEIADKCPWLENKLIDFTYFLKEGIISPSEYSNLMYKIQNDLRIVNGKLLYLTDTYYRALKEKTKVIANITNQLDALAANFHANVVNPIAQGKNPDAINNFISEYNLVFSNLDNNIPILDYNEIVSDYFEKYFNAEQKFLKNVYLFKKYFDEPCSLTFNQNSGIYEYTLEAENVFESDNFVSFGTPLFSRWTYKNDITDLNEKEQFNEKVFNKPVFLYENGDYRQYTFINENNATNYYYAELTAAQFTAINSDYNYDVDYKNSNLYYLTETDYNTYFGNPNDTFVKDGQNYCKLKESEIEKLILLSSEGDKYYTRDTKQYVPFDWVRLGCNQIKNIISWFSLPNMSNFFDTENIKDNYTGSVFKKGWTSNNGFAWKYYKSFFPLSEIYYKGNNIDYSSTINQNNEKEYTINKKEDICYQTMPFLSNGSMLSNWGPCVNEEGLAAKQAMKANWSYYTLTYNRTAATVCGISGGVFALTALGLAFTPLALLGGLSALAVGTGLLVGSFASTGTKTSNSFNTLRSFEGKEQIRNYATNEKELEDYEYNIDAPYAFYKYDSYHANFITSENALKESTEAINVWYSYLRDKNKEVITTNGQNWMSSNYNISDSSDSNWNGSTELYQYFNFYKYVAATYSFKRKFTEKELINNHGGHARNINEWYDHCTIESSDLFVKNKYLRIISSQELINKKDKYILIPLYESIGENAHDWTNDEDTGFIMQRSSNRFINMGVLSFDENKIPKSILIGEKDHKWLDRKFSSLTFYPLIHSGVELDFNSLKDLVNSSYPLEEVIDKISLDNHTWVNLKGIDKEDEASVLYYYSDNNGIKSYRYYLICHVEDYEKGLFKTITNSSSIAEAINYSTTYTNPNNYYINPLKTIITNIYDITTDLKANVFSKGIITKVAKDLNLTIYMQNTEDDVMLPVTKFNENLHFYEKIDNAYKPIYSRKQIFFADTNSKLIPTEYQEEEGIYLAPTSVAKNMYYIGDASYTITDFIKTRQKFYPTLYLCSIERNGDNVVFKSEKSNIYKELDFNNQETLEGIIQDSSGKQYPYSFKKSINVIEPNLNAISNGTLWYKYRNKIDWTIIFEAAASIETQLEMYWQQAYTASKYCKYFLPEHWQPTVDNIENHFSPEIIVPINYIQDSNGNKSTKISGVTLSSKYLPNVEIYINDTYSNSKYKHYLPKYLWRWNPTHTNTFTSIAEDKAIIAQDNNNYISAEKVPVLHNKAVEDVLNHFNSNLSDWEVVENGYTIYYYNIGDSTGTTWSELTRKLGSYSFDYFDGLYGMAYRIFNSKYTNRAVKDYEEAMELKRNIWNGIYQQYPFIMLEDNYTYDLATSSSELLKMAELVFKNKKEPEKEYTISLLDINSLSGYKGQEIFPGQGILLKANEYYDTNDSIYNALNQYIFITDVSYSLRSDGDISITVNSIKYEEKLLQSLVKLIR